MLQVIPQLIARIDTPRSLVGRLVHQLLVDIGKAHPQVSMAAHHSLLPCFLSLSHSQCAPSGQHSCTPLPNGLLLSLSAPSWSDLPTVTGRGRGEKEGEGEGEGGRGGVGRARGCGENV